MYVSPVRILSLFINTVHCIICTLCLYNSLPQVCSALYQFIINKVNVHTETQELYMYLVNYLYKPFLGLLHFLCAILFKMIVMHYFYYSDDPSLWEWIIFNSLTTKFFQKKNSACTKKKNHDTKGDSNLRPWVLQFKALPTWPLHHIGKL